MSRQDGRAQGGGAAGRLLRAALAAALVAALGIFHVWTRTRVVAAGYELGQASAERQRLSSEGARLRIEVESLRAPHAVEPFARTRLGMAPPAPGTVWVTGPRIAEATAGAGVDGVGHRPGPAEPAGVSARAAGRAGAREARRAADGPVALRGPPSAATTAAR